MLLDAVQGVNYLRLNRSLDLTTEPLNLPDVAARLGLFLKNRNDTILLPFTGTELINGYTDPNGNRYAGYPNHGTYVDAVVKAGLALQAKGLWDPVLG